MEKKRVVQYLAKAGYKLRPESCDLITEAYIHFEKSDVFLVHFIDTIQSIWAEKDSKFSSTIEPEITEEAIFIIKKEAHGPPQNNQEMNIEDFPVPLFNDPQNHKDDLLQDHLVILSNFDGRHLHFEDKSGQVILKQDICDFLPNHFNLNFQIEKYNFLRWLLERSGKFFFENSEQQFSREKIKINEIGSLSGLEGHFFIFGIIFKHFGDFYVQDQLSTLKISLNRCLASAGYVTLGSYVILEGSNFESVFIVDEVRFPDLTIPAKIERLCLFKSAFHGSINQEINRLNLGNNSQTLKFNSNEHTLIKNIGQILRRKDSEFKIRIANHFILSDESFSAIDSFLCESEKSGVDVLVLCGPFFNTSVLRKSDDKEKLQRCLGKLSEIFAKLENKTDGMIVLMIPDVNDFGLQTFPKKGLSENLFNNLQTVFPNLFLCQNPCHFMVRDKSFLISKTNLIIKALRSTIIPVNTTLSPFEHIAKNVVGQRDLLPFSCQEYVSVPKARSKLLLYEIPDFLVFCDDLAGKNSVFDSENKCFVSPGNFLHSGDFVTIQPFKGNVVFGNK